MEGSDGFLRQGVELSLAFRPIVSIPGDLAAREGREVELLNLTECELANYHNLHHFCRLKTLVLDKNNLSDLQNCPSMPSVSTLWFNNNCITDLAPFMDQVIEKFTGLTELSMMRNPACPGLMDIQQPDLEACRLYRLYVVYRMPQLRVVDGNDVTQEERKNAKLRGHFAVKRRVQEVYQPKTKVGFFERAPSTVFDPLGVTPAADVAAYHSPRKSVTHVHFTSSRRRARADGRHSEGNRFIQDDHL